MYHKKRDCSCGRSPTGKCIGWHRLTEEEYQKKSKVSVKNVKTFYCEGDPELHYSEKHPIVYYTFNGKNPVRCEYCNMLYYYKETDDKYKEIK